MTGMFYQWLRWQCLNRRAWNDGEIPVGTTIDEDEFAWQLMGLLSPRFDDLRDV